MHRRLQRWGIGLGLLVSSCTGLDYPPPMPAQIAQVPWGNADPFIPTTPPPPELRYQPPPDPATALLPSPDEWRFWKADVPTETTCQGKGKKRRCTKVPLNAVDQANVTAVAQPTLRETQGGTSGHIQYSYDPRSTKIYEIYTSPQEATYIITPEQDGFAMKVVVNPHEWEVDYSQNKADAARREVMVIRPTVAGLTVRGVMVLKSGGIIPLKILSRDRPGMVSVTWTLPQGPPVPPPLPLDQQPPVFNNARAYSQYTLEPEGTSRYLPAWWPDTVVDDGQNTLIKLRSLEGVPMPVVSALHPDGTPALVQSRLYTRPDHGAWIYVQGLHPALRLRDSTGMAMKAVRQVPARVTEVRHAR